MVPLGTHRGAISTRAGRASVCVYGCSAGCMTTAPKVGRPPSWLVKGCTQGPREQVHVWQAGWAHLPSESLHEDLRAASTSGHTNIVRPHLLLGGETFPENHYQSLNRWSPWREIEAGHSEQWPATLSHFPGYRHSKQGCLQSEIYWSKHWTLAALSLAKKRTSQDIDLPMLHGNWGSPWENCAAGSWLPWGVCTQGKFYCRAKLAAQARRMLLPCQATAGTSAVKAIKTQLHPVSKPRKRNSLVTQRQVMQTGTWHWNPKGLLSAYDQLRINKPVLWYCYRICICCCLNHINPQFCSIWPWFQTIPTQRGCIHIFSW